MKVIMGGVASGKTYRLVKDCVEADGIMFVASVEAKQYIMAVARELGVKCPEIFTAREVEEKRYLGIPFNGRKIFIDDMRWFLYSLFNCRGYVSEVVLEGVTEKIDLGEFPHIAFKLDGQEDMQ